MSAPSANGKPTAAEKLERELLARLGLDTSASPEDVAAAHAAVSTYLAAAPKGLRGWARTQAAGTDEAYALLTDPAALSRAVALVGAGARPAVRPGGPATPPVHRDTPAPAAAAVVPAAAAAAPPKKSKPAVDEDGRRIVSDDEIDALLAEVDPSAHPEIVGTPEERAARQHRLVDVEAVSATQPSLLDRLAGSRVVRNVALVGTTVAAVLVLGFATGTIGGPGSLAGIGTGIGAGNTPAPSAPVLDQAAVSDLMARIQADPNDADALMSLGDEYYKIGDFATAANWFRKVTEVEATAVRGFLALGAASFNQGDLDTAETAWKQAAEIDDTNVEAHYDLGFLYLNRQPADMAQVKLHWNRVVELAPDSEIAQTVKAHLDVFAEMSPAPGASAAPEGSAAPAATPAPDASAAPAATPAPSGTPVP